LPTSSPGSSALQSSTTTATAVSPLSLASSSDIEGNQPKRTKLDEPTPVPSQIAYPTLPGLQTSLVPVRVFIFLFSCSLAC
jgi:hypothetical protein